MSKPATIFSSAVAALVLATAVCFAVFEYVSYTEARDSFNDRMERLQDAQAMASKHSQIFRTGTATVRKDLKGLVQEVGAKNGISIIYLNETERDAGDMVRERNVVARAVNVPHAKLVTFLADLESRGNGARIKEIRLKPALDKSDVYQEAESVLAVRSVIESQLKAGSKEAVK